MKNLKKHLGFKVVLFACICAMACSLFAVTACSSGTTCLGSWTCVAGADQWSSAYLGSTYPMSSSDTVTLFDDGTYIWATDSSLGYYDKTSDSYTSRLSQQSYILYGEYTLVENTEFEVQELTITSVTRVVANGWGDGMRTEFDTDDATSEDYTADDYSSFITYMYGLISSEIYELDYYGRISMTVTSSLGYKVWLTLAF